VRARRGLSKRETKVKVKKKRGVLEKEEKGLSIMFR
jgi:hypothetical protein